MASFRTFTVLLVLATSAVTLSFHWFGFAVLPQPYRFQQEWEIAVVLLISVCLPLRTLPLVLALLIPFASHINRQAQELIRPVTVGASPRARIGRPVDERLERRAAVRRLLRRRDPNLGSPRRALHDLSRWESRRSAADASISWLRAYGVQPSASAERMGVKHTKPSRTRRNSTEFFHCCGRTEMTSFTECLVPDSRTRCVQKTSWRARLRMVSIWSFCSHIYKPSI